MFCEGEQVKVVTFAAGDPEAHVLGVADGEVVTVNSSAGPDAEWVWCSNTSNKTGYVASNNIRNITATLENEEIYDNDVSRTISAGEATNGDDDSDSTWEDDDVDQRAASPEFSTLRAVTTASSDEERLRGRDPSPPLARSPDQSAQQANTRALLENMLRRLTLGSRNEGSLPGHPPPGSRNEGSSPGHPPPGSRNEGSSPGHPPPGSRNEGSSPGHPPPGSRNEGSSPGHPPPGSRNERSSLGHPPPGSRIVGSSPSLPPPLPHRRVPHEHKPSGAESAVEPIYWKVAVGSRDKTFGDFEVIPGDIVMLIEESSQHELHKVLVQSVKDGAVGYVPETHIIETKSLDHKPWFVGFESREAAETRLRANGVPEGTFLVRESENLTTFVLSIKSCQPGGAVEVRHRRVAQVGSKYYAWKGYEYPSIEAMVRAHRSAEGENHLKNPYNKYEFPNY